MSTELTQRADSTSWIRMGVRAMAACARHLALGGVALSLVALAACSGARSAAGPCCDAVTADVAAEPCDRPPEAKPGEAWCRVWMPPVTKEISETFCVRPACVKKVPVPPTYGSRTEIICVQPAQIREVTKPAVWTSRKRQVLVCPERECVERVQCEPGNLAEGEVQCQCYAKKRIAPVYQEIEEGVCLSPSTLCVEYQPAEYKYVERQFVLKPAHCAEVPVAAQHETRIRTVVCQPGRWEWRRNDACELPEEGLTAIEVTMVDSAPDGSEAGIFRVGEEVRYDLEVLNDVGGKALEGLRVVFTLPAELEYVSGGGSGLSFVGKAQQAQSSSFALAVNQRVAVRIVARVLRTPTNGNMVQTVASVVGADGSEFVNETESSTLEGSQ